MKDFTPFVRPSSRLTAGLARRFQALFCVCQTISTPIVTGLVWPSRAVVPVKVCRTMA
jgi:hypothetical protein